MDNLEQKTEGIGPIQRANEEVESEDMDRVRLTALNTVSLFGLVVGAGILYHGILNSDAGTQGFGYGLFAGNGLVNGSVRTVRYMLGKPVFKYSKKEKE